MVLMYYPDYLDAGLIENLQIYWTKMHIYWTAVICTLAYSTTYTM